MNRFPKEFEAVPEESKQLFTLCWQVEEWLRLLVYVELRRSFDDLSAITDHKLNQQPISQKSDKAMSHMATAHESALSYLSLGQLWKIIIDPQYWPLFEQFFPPLEIAKGKMAEFSTIRNRVAHFRRPSASDLDRAKLFVKDLNLGLHLFCKAYTVQLNRESESRNALNASLEKMWQDHYFGIEMHLPNGDWLYAGGEHQYDPLMNANITWHNKFYSDKSDEDMAVLSLSLSATNTRYPSFDFDSVYRATVNIHNQIIHFIVVSKSKIIFTFRASGDYGRICTLISNLLQTATSSLSSHKRSESVFRSDNYHEIVIPEGHPLCHYDAVVYYDERPPDLIQLELD
ncbi:MAG: hypothetical protein KF836_04950 [Fimbriimonadaceae bacterium]|nr:hypothetical protein [Fimbriimonadaceae bacterium]